MSNTAELEERLAMLMADNARLETINQVLEVSSEGFIIGDNQERLLNFNPFFLEIWGLSQENVSYGMALEQLRRLLSSQLKDGELKALPGQVLQPSQAPTKTLPLLLVDGRMLEQYSYPMHLKERRGWIWRFRDVTQQRQIEHALFQNRQYLDRILTNAPMLIFATDAQGSLSFLRGRELRKFNFTQNQYVGENIFSRTDFPVSQAVQRALAGETVNNILELEGGYLDIHCNPLHNEEGVVIGMIGVGLDVSQEREAKAMRVETRELNKAKQEAEAANIAKTSFLANMSHELRTPLNAVLGFTQLLLADSAINQNQRELISLIMDSGEHLLSLINDILEMSKIETGKIEMQAVDFDLYEVLENLISVHHGKALAKGVSFESNFADNLPRYLYGDRNKLRQILVNLLTNAIKYTETGGIRFSAWAEDDFQGDGCHLFFEVEDTGLGIAHEELALLFSLFTQTSSGQKIQSGTGLGLSISQEFARLMRGNIKVESRVGEGSRFIADVYLENARSITEKREYFPQAAVKLAPGQEEYRILVVEDKWESRLLMLRILEAAGFSVREAINGREALQIWQEWNPHLIWMDMKLPLMNGYETTRQIRSSDAGKDVVIIALTASVFEHERDEALRVGCNDYLAKPFQAEDLFEKIRIFLKPEFVYSEAPATAEPKASSRVLQSKLGALPAQIHEALHTAVVQYSLSNVEKVCREIALYDETLAQEIEGLAKEFDFKTILSLLPE